MSRYQQAALFQGITPLILMVLALMSPHDWRVRLVIVILGVTASAFAVVHWLRKDRKDRQDRAARLAEPLDPGH